MIIAICKAAFKVEGLFVEPKAMYAAVELQIERQYCGYQDSGDTDVQRPFIYALETACAADETMWTFLYH